jgi:hypothetical protein
MPAGPARHLIRRTSDAMPAASSCAA